METDRLILRPWEPSDSEALYRYAKDPRIGPAAGWPPHSSVQESKTIIETVFSAPEIYAVVLRQTEEPVGCIGVLWGDQANLPLSPGEGELGYWVGGPYWGQGLIPEGVQAVLRHCFLELGCPGLWCGHYDGNRKSQRVQEKCGFLPQYSRTVPVPLLHEVRTEHVSYLSRTRWIQKWEGGQLR
ncbi:MAG: GNAT family N-acetyltransferase [Evtepia sp.]|uniref:GNAT family N-acetyltransferase n=1 Tax=Evtepia sp. TaxID=2773933 RepID=UPI002A747EFF|nr:GNAT family N-acetyltransferase [Evtepia sp.]MDY3013607.1 GNAT family N-acetyltransferase [Evtepia sp.]